MATAMLIVGGLTFYVALLVTEPIVQSLHFAMFCTILSSLSWLLFWNISPLVILIFFSLCVISLLLNIRRLKRLATFLKTLSPTPRPLYTILVLGSGGHTKELLYMLTPNFPPHPLSHRRYLITSGDRLSLAHLTAWESAMASAHPAGQTGTYDVVTVPRARCVHQSVVTAPFTVLWSIVMVVPALLKRPRDRGDLQVPDVVVSNGPATGFCAVAVAWGVRVLGVVPETKLRSLYVESWARISSLSMTGKLFWYTGIVDRFVVQHEEVARKYRVENAGWLVLGGGKHCEEETW